MGIKKWFNRQPEIFKALFWFMVGIAFAVLVSGPCPC